MGKRREARKAWKDDPFVRVLEKTFSSKGALAGRAGEEQVLFIPSAVLIYGFAHLPTESDPDGTLWRELPASPDAGLTKRGVYVFTPKSVETASFNLDPHVQEAHHVYIDSGRAGMHPFVVFGTLQMQLDINQLFIQVDPTLKLDAQLTEFRSWWRRVRQQIHGRRTPSLRSPREAARNTLIFTLRHSLGLPVRTIAEETFPREDTEEREAKVRAILSRTRKALIAARVGPLPPLPRLPTRRGRRPGKSELGRGAAPLTLTKEELLAFVRDLRKPRNVT